VRIAAAAVLVACIAGFFYWWMFRRNFVSTDDAYARADSAQISSRVPATVARVLVENDFAVSAGQPLVELDPADYKVAVDRARAVLDQDEAELRGAEITVPRWTCRPPRRFRLPRPHLKAPRTRSNKAATHWDSSRAAGPPPRPTSSRRNAITGGSKPFKSRRGDRTPIRAGPDNL